MKNSLLKSAVLAALGLLVTSSVIADDDWDKDFRLYLGSKTLDARWDEHKELATIGFMFDFKPSAWPVSLAFDVFGEGHEAIVAGEKHELTIAEAHLGIRYQCAEDCGDFKPYLGAGLAVLEAEEIRHQDGQKLSDDDTANGHWIALGVDYSLSTTWSVGADYRCSTADVRLYDTERETKGTKLGVHVGYHF